MSNKRWHYTGVIFLLMVFVGGLMGCSDDSKQAKSTADWRKSGTPEEQLKALVNITPGTHHWMPEIAYRYQSLYWAAEQGKWDFADYQIRSMEKMIKRVAKARVKRAPSIQVFRENAFPALYQAAKSRDIEKFRAAVAYTASECVACHAKEGFGYITVPPIPPKPNSIVLGWGSYQDGKSPE